MTTTAISTVPASVEVTKYEDPTGFYAEQAYTVSPVWAGVDRPNVGGIVVLSAKDAGRLTAAYLSGKAFESAEIKTDVYGNTYVCTSGRIMGRYLNADLKALGF